MLSFVNFSTPDTVQYLIIDEDAFYKWVRHDEKYPIYLWLEDRQTYKFKLEFEGKITNIAVYKDGERILREEVQDVIYL